MALIEFITSCDKFTEYPNNLVHRERTRPYFLRSLRQKLSDESPRLFCADGNAALVIIRYDRTRQQMVADRHATFRTLKQQFPGDASMGQRFSDCQLAFIEAKSARHVLNISKDMMLWLLSLFQVMPNFLEFMFLCGEQLYDS